MRAKRGSDRATLLALALATATAAGCGDRLVDGTFLGDSTIRLRGELGAHVPDPHAPSVGAIWLGYGGLSDPSEGAETTALPITSVRFPAAFTCEVLDPPPSAGRYQLSSGVFVPAAIRLARLVIFDDRDDDGTFRLDAGDAIAAPDRLLAQADQHVLLFVQHEPADPAALNAAGALLTNWENAYPGYHIVALDPAIPPPALLGHVVDATTSVIYTPPPPEALE